MRVAVVAGPDPGHSFPAIALCQRFRDAGDRPTLFTGAEWIDTARAAGIDAAPLDGLVATDEDLDAGARIHRRAARMAVLNVPILRELAPDLIVSDVITVCGGMAAELLGIPWVELNPQPLYLPSRGLPPLGSGVGAVPSEGPLVPARPATCRRPTWTGPSAADTSWAGPASLAAPPSIGCAAWRKHKWHRRGPRPACLHTSAPINPPSPDLPATAADRAR